VSGPYVVKDRDSGHYYRRGLGGSVHWVTALADSTRFSVYETAKELCDRLGEQDRYCMVRSLTFNQPELPLFA